MFKSSVLELLRARGLLYQMSDESALDNILQNEAVIYLGIDPTAKNLHIGNLVPLMIMKWIQKCGHKVIILIGGATARIGDPSGRSEERILLDEEEIKRNVESIKTFLKEFFQSSGSQLEVEILDNYSWLYKVQLLDLLFLGKNASVNKILSLDSIKNRLSRESYLSFTEFSYPLIQAYDFLHLHEKYHCTVQIGGADQWGNIVTGINLIKKYIEKNVYGITCPLILDSNGNKLGKSANNSITIDYENISTAYDYWQFWRNTNDADVYKHLKVFTFLPLEYIESMQDINEAKIILADEATSIVYGKEATIEAKKIVDILYGESDEQYESLSLVESVHYSHDELQKGIPYAQILVDTRLCSSISEAKKLIAGNGLKIDKVKVHDGMLSLSNFRKGNVTLISVGNKVRFVKLKTS